MPIVVWPVPQSPAGSSTGRLTDDEDDLRNVPTAAPAAAPQFTVRVIAPPSLFRRVCRLRCGPSPGPCRSSCTVVASQVRAAYFGKPIQKPSQLRLDNAAAKKVQPRNLKQQYNRRSYEVGRAAAVCSNLHALLAARVRVSVSLRVAATQRKRDGDAEVPSGWLRQPRRSLPGSQQPEHQVGPLWTKASNLPGMGSKVLELLALRWRQCGRHLAVLQEEGLRQGSPTLL
jgi:hypothetical protein